MTTEIRFALELKGLGYYADTSEWHNSRFTADVSKAKSWKTRGPARRIGTELIEAKLAACYRVVEVVKTISTFAVDWEVSAAQLEQQARSEAEQAAANKVAAERSDRLLEKVRIQSYERRLT